MPLSAYVSIPSVGITTDKAVVYCRCGGFSFLRRDPAGFLWKQSSGGEQEKWRLNLKAVFPDRFYLLMAGLCALLIVISVLFIEPSPYDDLPELSLLIGQQEDLYYPGYENSIFTFPELFYVMCHRILDLNIAVLIHTVSPVALLLFFFCVYDKITRTLFPLDVVMQKEMFLLSVGVFFLISFTDASLEVAVFRNIWNPVTLTTSCLLPLVMCYVLEGIESVKQLWHVSHRIDSRTAGILSALTGIAATMMAAQCMITQGFLQSGIVAIVTGVVYMIVRWGREEEI